LRNKCCQNAGSTLSYRRVRLDVFIFRLSI